MQKHAKLKNKILLKIIKNPRFAEGFLAEQYPSNRKRPYSPPTSTDFLCKKDQLKQPTTKAPAPCFIKAIPFKPRNNLQPGKILFQARKRAYDARKDMRSRITRKQSKKPFRARQRGKMSIYKVFQSAAARKNKSLQTSEKLSASLWLKFYVWRRYSPNKENFLSVIKTLFQARKRAYNARKDRRIRNTRKQPAKPFRPRQDGKTSCRAFIKATHALQI